MHALFLQRCEFCKRIEKVLGIKSTGCEKFKNCGRKSCEKILAIFNSPNIPRSISSIKVYIKKGKKQYFQVTMSHNIFLLSLKIFKFQYFQLTKQNQSSCLVICCFYTMPRKINPKIVGRYYVNLGSYDFTAIFYSINAEKIQPNARCCTKSQVSCYL